MEAHKNEQLQQIFSGTEIQLLEKIIDACADGSQWVRSGMDDPGHGTIAVSLTINSQEWNDLISLRGQLCLPF